MKFRFVVSQHLAPKQQSFFFKPEIQVVTIQIVEYFNRRKNESYSKHRKNSIAAIIFRL